MTTTHPTATIAAFLTAQLDADEAAARAANPGPWSHGQEGLIGGDVIRSEAVRVARVYASTHPEWAEETANAAHIARHDPARVLAQVEAHREIVELHESVPAIFGSPYCAMCGETDRGQRLWPCPTLRALASIYAGADGYDARWAL